MPLTTGTPLPKEPSARKVRADAISVIGVSVLAAAAVITLAVLKFAELFVPGGIAWNLPVHTAPGAARGLMSYTSDGPVEPVTVTGTITQLQVVVSDVNPVSTAAFTVAIVIAALTALTVIACTARLAWTFLRGRFFTRQASVALTTLIQTLAIGGVVAFALWHLGSNGIEGALDMRATATNGPEWWSWYAIFFFAFCSFGLVDIALRRAIRLQRDTEGLV